MGKSNRGKSDSAKNVVAKEGKAPTTIRSPAAVPVRADLAGWRPPTTVAQTGSVELDWSRTFHVDTPAAFINGLFGLYSSIFADFLNDAGKLSAIGETVLYQVKDPVHLRFEMMKIGPNEYEVRGAHFATPNGTNICIGMDPLKR